MWCLLDGSHWRTQTLFHLLDCTQWQHFAGCSSACIAVLKMLFINKGRCPISQALPLQLWPAAKWEGGISKLAFCCIMQKPDAVWLANRKLVYWTTGALTLQTPGPCLSFLVWHQKFWQQTAKSPDHNYIPAFSGCFYPSSEWGL